MMDVSGVEESVDAKKCGCRVEMVEESSAEYRNLEWMM
jgi:hypothetical protein